MFEFICGPLQNSSHTITVQKSSTCLNDRPNSETEMFYYVFLLSRYSRYHSRFFAQVGHETTCASSGNKHTVGFWRQHTDRFLVEMFHNYAFKECRKFEIVAIDTAKNTSVMTILIKQALGNIFI